MSKDFRKENEEKIIPKWELIKDVYKNYFNVRKNFWWLFLLLLLNIVFIISEPYFYKLFIDNIEKFASDKISYDNIKGEFIFLAIAWTIISIAGVIAKWIYELFSNRMMEADWKDYVLKLWENFIFLPYSEFISTNPWKQQSIFDKWTMALWNVAYTFLISILPQVLIFLSLFVFWFYINWKMTLVSLIFVPLSIYISLKIWNIAFNMQKSNNENWNKSYQRFNDALNNISIIKVFSKEKQENEILDSYFSDTIDKQVDTNLFWTLLDALLQWIQVFWRISVMIFWVFFVIKWHLTIWELLVFVYISWRIIGPINSLLNSFQSIIRELANYHKSKLVIDAPKEKNDWTIKFDWLKNNIVLKNVSFNYEKSDREIIKNLNLQIKKWQKVALVGHTWSWKTTISNLITKFYDVISWEVLIDSIDIKDIELTSYRSRIAAVFQDTTVFNDTILNNLKYIKMDASLDEIREACKKAEILDFIEKLEKWFDTEVWEKWLKLSGWERQRIAIARAILRDPDILILDEPTSALDSKTESIIQKSLNNLMRWRTSIIIAHRLSTIKNADKIFLLENGELLDSGTHDELYESSKAYKEMVDYQKNGFLEE